ncbi:unnamed protein product [Prorocentrum cordatum]|uniref:Uncharacterized protein n=1 Tax=Prorocentrum cordatum TaxID=2364126 RepID=A0ABN9XD84_9DINO|nr:unnamed protein product [Polarella glacialis]
MKFKGLFANMCKAIGKGALSQSLPRPSQMPFEPHEIATFLGYVLRKRGDPKLPTDPDGLYQTVEAACNAADLAFDGKSAKMAPPVNLKLLSKALRKKPKAVDPNQNRPRNSRCCLM